MPRSASSSCSVAQALRRARRPRRRPRALEHLGPAAQLRAARSAGRASASASAELVDARLELDEVAALERLEQRHVLAPPARPARRAGRGRAPPSPTPTRWRAQAGRVERRARSARAPRPSPSGAGAPISSMPAWRNSRCWPALRLDRAVGVRRSSRSAAAARRRRSGSRPARAIGIVMSERSASTSPVLVEQPVARRRRRARRPAQHVLVLQRRRPDLAVAGAARRRRAGASESARSSRISSGRMSRVPGGIGWVMAALPRRALGRRRARSATRSMRAPSAAQPLVDPLVAAVDLADVADLRARPRRTGRDEHRHAGPDVRALHALAMKPARAADDRPVRVAERSPERPWRRACRRRTGGSRTSSRGSAPVPSAWVATASAMLVRSAGNAGQGPSSIFGIASPSSSLDAQALLGRHDHVVAVVLDPAAEPLEHQPGHAQVVGHACPDAQLAAGDGGQRDEAADLDVVGADRVVGAAEPLLRRARSARSSRSPRCARPSAAAAARGPARAARRRRCGSPSCRA